MRIVTFAVAFLCSGIPFLGWVFKVPALVQLTPEIVPMQLNTAFCFGLCIYGLWKEDGRATLVAGIVGLLTLVQYKTGINLEIDTLFADPIVTTHTSHPGRMAPNTAFCFLLLSLAHQVRPHWLKLLLIGGGGAFSGVALLGYAIGLEALFAWGAFTHMAPQTAIAFQCLFLSETPLFRSRETLNEIRAIIRDAETKETPA